MSGPSLTGSCFPADVKKNKQVTGESPPTSRSSCFLTFDPLLLFSGHKKARVYMGESTSDL